MEIPRWLRRVLRLKPSVEVATAAAGVSDAAAPDGPTPSEPGSDAKKPATEKWRDGRRGFLDAQLRTESRMARYNQHLVITTLRRFALGAAGLATSGTVYLIHASDTGAGKVTLVVLAWLMALIALIAMAMLSRPQQSSAEKPADKSKRETKQDPNTETGEDGDESGHRTPHEH